MVRRPQRGNGDRDRGEIDEGGDGATEIYRAHPASDEIAELLEGRLTAALGIINNDGSVHLAYVIFLYKGGRFYLETSSVIRKARNAKARGRASMLIQGHTPSGTIVMVSVEGSARVVDGTEAREVNHRLRAKYIKSEALDAIDRA